MKEQDTKERMSSLENQWINFITGIDTTVKQNIKDSEKRITERQEIYKERLNKRIEEIQK